MTAKEAAIRAEFMRQVYLAEKMRQARMAGLLPAPTPDPLARRLWRLVSAGASPDRELWEALAEAPPPDTDD